MIEVKEGRVQMGGTPQEVANEYLVLTHAFVDGVFPHIPDSVREKFKAVIVLAMLEECGMDELVNSGLMDSYRKVDLSNVADLKRRADDETNR